MATKTPYVKPPVKSLADELRKKQIAAQKPRPSRTAPNTSNLGSIARGMQPKATPLINRPALPQGKKTVAGVARSLLPKPVAEPPVATTPSETGATFDERVQAEMDRPYAEQAATEEKLFGQSITQSSLEQEIMKQAERQKGQTAQAERKAAFAETQGLEEGRRAQAGIRSNEEAGVSAMATGRQGPSSSANISAQQSFRTEAGRQMAYLGAQREEAQAGIRDYLEQARQAEADGNSALAQQYRNEAIRAENDVRQLDIDYLNTLTAQSAENRANFNTFSTLVDNGIELSTEGLMTYADQMGLDFGMVKDYYEGAQMIRDDKSMDAATKEIELNNLAYDFDRKLRGIETQEAINVDNYMSLVKSGQYTPEQLQAFAISMNIPDENNPVFQAELRLSEAQAKIAGDQANGVLTNPMDLVDLAQKTYDYYESIGYDPSMVPVGGEYGAVSYTTPDGIQGVRFGVEDGQNYDNPATARDESQCGAFVNDITGLGMGDGFNTGANNKMSFVDASIKVPAAGMVYVIPANGSYAKNGHTGMVEYFNPSTSMVGVVSANANGDGKIVREEIPLSTILNGGGFAVPPNAKPANEMVTLDQVPKDLRTAVTTKANQFDAEPTVKSFQKVQEGWNFVNSLDPKNSTSADDQALIYAFAKIMDPDSVVREGEYATIQKYSQSWAETFGFNALRVADNVEFLSKEAKENMKKTLESKYNVSKASYDNVRNGYVQAIDNLGQTPGIGSSILQDYAFEYGAGAQTPVTSEEDTINQWIQPTDGRNNFYDEFLTPPTQ